MSIRKLADRINKVYTPAVLKLVQYNNPQFLVYYAEKQMLSSIISISRKVEKYYIPSLKITAVLYIQAHHGLVGLAAPEATVPYKMFCMHKEPKENQWTGYKAVPEDYNVYLDPEIHEERGEPVEGVEECCSIPQ